MKKLLVTLLCVVMLLACAGAMAEEATQTFGEFICKMNDEGLEIVDYALAEGQTELYIPKGIDGHRVQHVGVEKLPESVKKVYMHDSCGWDGELKPGRELTVIQYVDYDWVMADEWYSKYLTDMGEDDYALLWANVFSMKEDGELREKEASAMYAEELPAELGGHKVHITMMNNRSIIYTSGDWQYTLDTYDNGLRADIVGVKLADGARELVVPQSIDGYQVQRVGLSAIPASVEVIYIEYDAWLDNDGGERTLKVIRYEDYAGVQKDDWRRERVPDMTENDLALLSVERYTFSADGNKSTNSYVYAEDLPTELLGKNCLNGLYADNVRYVSGRWTYTLSSDGKEANIVDVSGAEGQTMLYVPSTIEGAIVSRIDGGIADKCGITLFVAPRNSWISGEYTSSFGVLSYYDRAWVDARQDDYYTEHYAWMTEKDLSLEDYGHYSAGESTKDTIEYKDIPTEVEDYRVFNNITFENNVTLHKKDDFTYIILADDTIAVTRYENETAKSLIIPARIDGKTVTALMGDNYNWVIYNSDLNSLELPSTLKVLGKKAIYAWSLKKLEIPAGVTEIGESAVHCYKLGSLKLPEGVTKLGKNWLYGKVKSINFPASLTTLEANAFSDAEYIASVKLPDTVTNVGVGAFSEMYKLSALTLPATMKEIPENLASASERLAKITIPAATEIIGKKAFAGCVKLSSVTFAKKDAQIKVIGEGAFSATALGKIVLPEGVTTVRKEAFQGCTKLSGVTLPATLTKLERYAFSGCTALGKIVLPESLTTIEEGTFMGCKKLANVTIPASVTAIEDFAFEGCSAKLVLTVSEGSFAQQWAEENGYTVKLAKVKK